jgi:hypothetical protein
VTLLNASGLDDETPRQWFLNPGESSSSSDPPSVAVPGWTGACFDPENPNVVAVARRFAKTVDVFDGDRLIRSMRAPLQPERGVLRGTRNFLSNACRNGSRHVR